MSKLSVVNLCKKFGNKNVLENISVNLEPGEIVGLLGESGIGKSTLFNIIAGFITPDSGDVFLDGNVITGEIGKIGYMQQKDLLLSYKNIVENVALPLIIGGEKKSRAIEIAESYFESFGINGTENKYPHELSGGMRQRASLLRTYLMGTDVIILDEPFSALDYITKMKLQIWYIEMAKKMGFSTFFITHDIDEAIFLSDRMYFMSSKKEMNMNEIYIDRQNWGGDKVGFKRSDYFYKYKFEIENKIFSL